MMREIPIEKNDDIEFTIDALGSEGQGIGRVDGYTVFVPLALPGEKIRAHVIKTTSGYGVAKLTEVMEPSKDRAQQDCPAYPRCGGCSMRHMSYAAQLAAKTKQVRDAFIRLGRFDGSEINVQPCHGMEHPDRYRNKGSFPYGYDENHCIVPGFFSPRSHRIVPIADCPIQSENIMAAVRVVTDWAREYNITPYDEQKRCGLLRHCMVRESSSGVIVMVVTAGKLPYDIELVEMLRASIPHLIGVVHNLNKADTNIILGNRFTTLWGNERLPVTVCGHSFQVSMPSFLQVNPVQTEVLYSYALDFLDLNGGERVADVYCGIGTITLMLAEHAKEVIGIECVPEAISDANRSASENGIANAKFICGNAEDVLPRLVSGGTKLDCAVIDPPRKGCDEAVLKALAQSGVSRIVYISCNPATLARDCRMLADMGYCVEKIQPVDMFPWTYHVETVILLSKGEIDSKKVRVEFSLEDMDMSGFQKGATYEQIKAYVLEHTGLKVSSLYISQIKRKCGLDVGQNYNLSKKEDAKVPKCPPEKEAAIRDALKYFQMI